jgi:hypothetical protein
MSRPKKPKDKTSERYMLEEADRLQKEEERKEGAFLRAWLQKYGWPIGEKPPRLNAEIIPFPANRTRRKP